MNEQETRKNVSDLLYHLLLAGPHCYKRERHIERAREIVSMFKLENIDPQVMERIHADERAIGVPVFSLAAAKTIVAKIESELEL